MNVTKSLNAPSEDGLLLVVLLQQDTAVDPVTVKVFCTPVSGGNEYLVGQYVAQTPDSAKCKGNRAVAIVNVPATGSYRCEADSGASLEPLDVLLTHGNASDALLLGMFTPIFYEGFPVLAAAPDATKSITSNLGAVGVLGCFVNQPDGSIRRVYNRLMCLAPDGVTYFQGAQIMSESPSVAGTQGKRATMLADVPAVTTYRYDAWCVDAITLDLKYGALDNVVIPNGIAINPYGPNTGGGQTALSTECWVDGQNGNDATAERGNILRPFKTIGAALANAKSAQPTPTTIFVVPGTYNESVTILAADGPFKDITLQAQGYVVWDGGANPALRWFADNALVNSNLDRWRVNGFTFRRSGTNTYAVVCDGAPNPVAGSASVFDQGLRLEACQFDGCTFSLNYAGRVFLPALEQYASGANSIVDTCLFLEASGFMLRPGDWSFNGAVHQGQGRATWEVSGMIYTGLNMSGCPDFTESDDCKCTDQINFNGVPAYDAGNGIDLSASLNLDGEHVGVCNLNMGNDASILGGTSLLSLRGKGTYRNNVNVDKNAASTQVLEAKFQNSVFYQLFNTSGALVGNLMGASYQQANLSSVAPSSIKRNTHRIPANAFAAGANAIAINPPFPDANYSAAVEPAGANAFDVTAKAGALVTIDSTGVVSRDITLTYTE